MFNWREVPLFRIILPFILGIALYLWIGADCNINNYFLFLFSAYLIYAAFSKIQFRWQWINSLLVNSFFVLLGYQLAFYQNDWNNKDHFREYLTAENLIIGKVVNAPTLKERTIQVNLEIQQIGQNSHELHDCSGKVMLSLRNDTINQKINYGDLILVKTSLEPVKPVLNPDAFDYKQYLHYKNIHYQAYVPTEQWQRLEGGHGNPILSWAFKMRLSLIQTLRNNLRFENEFAVASALILGYKEELSAELKNAYSNTGAMHVLAVSGLHVGLIWGIIAFFLNWIRWKHPVWKPIKTGITIVCLWLFALITGASPSVLRAATMFTFLLIGNTLNRNPNIYNTLAGSAFCLLLFNPYLIIEVGFQLSYLAVVGIVFFYRKIYSLWYIENRVGDYLWSLTSVAIAAQLSTFPLSLFYFHQFPVYFWLSGLVVVPFAFLILGTGLSLFFIDKVFPFLSPLFAKILIACLWLMNAIIFLIAQLPSGFFKDVWIEWGVMILLYLFIFSIVLAINSKKFKWLIFGVGILTIMNLTSFIKSIANEEKPNIVFYHLPGKSYVEFIDNKDVLSFGDREVSRQNLKFATLNYHRKNKINEVKPFYFGDENIELNHWFLKNGFIQFYDRKIVFIDDLPKTTLEEKIEVDFIVFRRRSKENVAELNQCFDYDKIIFDGSLYENQRLALKKECFELNIPFYDINQEGALIITID
jgi:competence protein ComEC